VAAARVRYHCACAGAMRSMERRGSEDPPVGAVRSVVRVGGATYGAGRRVTDYGAMEITV
jgi:hypothetical protein